MDTGKWLDRGLEKGEPNEKTIRMQELAKRLGFSNGTYLYKFIKGDRDLSKKQLAICAEYFGEPLPSAKKEAPKANGAARSHGIVPYPVMGIVEAGSFREADLVNDAAPRTLDNYRDDVYQNATPMAWEVRGDSMNRVGMVDGTIVFGVDFQETGGILQNEMIVVVEQNRGGLLERSIKAVAVFPDRTEFQPRSTNPIHKPIIYKNGKTTDAEVQVLTLVRRGENRY